MLSHQRQQHLLNHVVPKRGVVPVGARPMQAREAVADGAAECGRQVSALAVHPFGHPRHDAESAVAVAVTEGMAVNGPAEIYLEQHDSECLDERMAVGTVA